MSTKIYNGYKTDTGNIQMVVATLDAIGIEYDKAANKHACKLLADLISRAVDNKAVDAERWTKSMSGQGLENETLFWYARSVVQKEYDKIQRSKIRNPIFDFDMEITIFPQYKDFTPAMLFCENEEFKRILKDNPNVTEFAFWDNTDQPENVTDVEWKRRGDIWDECLGVSTPARRGLTRTYHGQFIPLVEREAVLAMIPTKMQRARKMAQHLLVNKYMAETTPNPQEDPQQIAYTSAFIKAADRAFQPENLDPEVQRLLPLLPDITKDTLRDKVL